MSKFVPSTFDSVTVVSYSEPVLGSVSSQSTTSPSTRSTWSSPQSMSGRWPTCSSSAPSASSAICSAPTVRFAEALTLHAPRTRTPRTAAVAEMVRFVTVSLGTFRSR